MNDEEIFYTAIKFVFGFLIFANLIMFAFFFERGEGWMCLIPAALIIIYGVLTIFMWGIKPEEMEEKMTATIIFQPLVIFSNFLTISGSGQLLFWFLA